ncbi:MAG: phosphatidate cytidylyltransferase [Chitinophagales bacterium]|nr:phosphatidate cytidylyltransferase [Bacteroidota bacterium]MBK7566719.1 phosphatidate cytidylyltransferase [Bacteroidota bacterium]MBP8916036.1 phosphatidate cytidylyltransferase [Chitinophagales bacterium]MBP9221473.1 phosphatidate cytidylyltransferase [Chitinophagales bacterium]MBP9795385.1 phosphatidate cytidylyltransferase [Chitinophagales bacterium]
MIHPVFYWIEAFFLLGAVGTVLANRKSTKAAIRERWMKLIIHFIIVNLLLILIIYLNKYFVPVMLMILVVGLFELAKYINNKRLLFYGVAVLMYVIFSIGFLLMAKNFNYNAVIYVFLIVFVFDGFSQITGQILGKHKLFPVTSPGKTWEGLAGGAIFALITGILTRTWINSNVPDALLISFVLIISATLGDWLASYYKRRNEIKDFSKLIPGHGGMLDRFDSWIVAGGVIYLFDLCGVFTFVN